MRALDQVTKPRFDCRRKRERGVSARLSVIMVVLVIAALVELEVKVPPGTFAVGNHVGRAFHGFLSRNAIV